MPMPFFPRLLSLVLLAAMFSPAARSAAAAPDKAPTPPPDVIVFSNGDRLTGKLVREINGTVTFHSDIAGDVNVPWDKIKELHSSAEFAVIEKGVQLKRKLGIAQIPVGTVHVNDGKIELESAAAKAEIPAIPVANAAFVIDQASLDKQLLHSPSFFAAWNGNITGGVTLVKATQSQYTVNSAVTLVRQVPTVPWLAARNRTVVDFSSSFGKITQPAYTSGGVTTPATYTKSNILHGDAERDEYFSPRFYYLGDLSLDHNYSQSLQLQQVYGGGVGWTAIKQPKQQLDLKLVAQYESQVFFNASAGSNQNLIGATIAANYLRKLPKGLVFNQQLNYLPAFNNSAAYSASETDTLTFPAFKQLGLTVGTLDTYLNDAPVTEPPTQRNSFQFTLGVTYGIKSKY
jgi:hypothetical protein